jgi:hypothetical protein
MKRLESDPFQRRVLRYNTLSKASREPLPSRTPRESHPQRQAPHDAAVLARSRTCQGAELLRPIPFETRQPTNSKGFETLLADHGTGAMKALWD